MQRKKKKEKENLTQSSSAGSRVLVDVGLRLKQVDDDKGDGIEAQDDAGILDGVHALVCHAKHDDLHTGTSERNRPKESDGDKQRRKKDVERERAREIEKVRGHVPG